MKEALEGKLVISILAGITMRQLTGWVAPTTRIVRAMPNTPCKVSVLPARLPRRAPLLTPFASLRRSARV